MKRVTCFQLSNSSFLRDENREKLEVILSTKCLDEIQHQHQLQQQQQQQSAPSTPTKPNVNTTISTPVTPSTPTQTGASATTEFDHFCNTCSIRFNDKELRNNHYRSQLHRYNLKLKMVKLPTLSELEFEQLIHKDGDNSDDSDDSDSDSDNSSDDSDTENVFKNGNGHQLQNNNGEEYHQGYQFYENSIDMNHPKVRIVSKDLKLQANVWRCLLATQNEFKTMTTSDKPKLINTFNRVCRSQSSALVTASSATPTPPPLTWAVLLCSGGRFAGALYKAPSTNKAFEHKTFHRYTTRKKQGGSQSTKDQQGGNKKSAGAAMRRYNEKRLREEVAVVLESWQSHLQLCSYIFIFAPKGNTRDILFYQNGPIHQDDPRIINIPFPIIKPTYSETQRVSTTLFTVDIDLLEDLSILEKEKEKEREREREREKELIEQQQQQQLKQQRKKKEEEDKGEKQQKEPKVNIFETDPLFIATKARDLNQVKRLLEDDSCNYELPIPDENDSIITPISIAIENKDIKMIQYLIQALPSDINISIEKWNFKTCLMKAAMDGSVEMVLALLDGGADPTIQSPMTGDTVYDSAGGHQKVRDALREWAGDHLDKWDYNAARIPPLTKQMIQEREEKKKLKKQQQKEKDRAKKQAEKEAKEKEEQLIKKKEEDRSKKLEEAKLVQQVQQTRIAKNDMLTERERRALAAEQRLIGGVKCTQCGIPIAGIPFERLNNYYCSTKCVVQHKNITAMLSK